MSTLSQSVELWPEPPLPTVELIDNDGVPLESPWHNAQINLLLSVLTWLWRDREDFYVGGNMFLYFSEVQARNRDYRGPDFFYVKGVPRRPVRPYWVVWQEGGRYPNVIVELLSPSTEREDRTTKKTLYEQTFRTPEYFCCKPEVAQLDGWRLDNQQRFAPLPANEHGRLWSQELGLWLGPWEGEHLGITGTWLRFYDADGRLVPTQAEAERQRAEDAQQQAEAERQRAANAQQQAEAERQRAEDAQQQAEAERQRATTAEAELARLRARLAELENQ